MRTLRLAVLAAALQGAVACQQAQEPRLLVSLKTDQAEAVLAILEAREAGGEAGSRAWERLFTSEGYRRLKAREAAMQVPFTDQEFREFVRSPELADRGPALRRALEAWKAADIRAAAARAFAYLPDGAVIRASVYPVIKPKANSFVHDLDTDPAIFLYLDPERNADKFVNTVAHELHHVGFAGACPDPEADAEADPEADAAGGVGTALDWASGFGEGVAMLAAAGSPDVHPHAASMPEERAVWDRDAALFERDMKRIQAFLLDLAQARLTDEAEIRRRGFELIVAEDVPQGPFYTVGWTVAATIEAGLGRDSLLAALCDPAAFLSAYNRAATGANRDREGPLALWSDSLIRALTIGGR